MGYNADTISLVTMTPLEQNAQQIAANTQAIAAINQAMNFLVSEFIRPNAQQHLQSLERLDSIQNIVESVAQQQQANTDAIAANAQQIAAHTDAIAAFDVRLEETRALVAENSSGIAQLNVSQQANAQQISAHTEAMVAFHVCLEETRALVVENSSGIAQLNMSQQANAQQILELGLKQDRTSDLIAHNGQQIAALAELTRTQLTSIIGNGRRIDRLEQAS